MANDQETNSRSPAFDPSSTPRLRYPTFPPLSRSVEEWLSQSRPTMSPNNLQPERPSSALSESWATLSSSDVHSEDGTRSEQTDMASLIDPNGPDDVASLDDHTSGSYDDDDDEDDDGDDVAHNYGEREAGHDIHVEDDRESVISDSQMLPQPRFARDLPAADDSGLTTKTLFFQQSESIEFSEPEKWPDMQRVELKHTISILDEEETASLKAQLPMNLDDCQLAITVQQTMTKQGLDLDKPFRVLYMGNPVFRSIIQDKIGDVLVSGSTHSLGSSSTESSRYHVVPTSFGTGATPNYAELLPIHVQLIVDECLDAVPSAPNHSNITLHFKNRTSCSSVWTGSEHQINSETQWTLPDLSIFFVSDRDTEANMHARYLAQSFMKTHNIPILIISEDPLWKKPRQRLFPFDHQSLHLCLESRRLLTGETVVLERYPIDVKTFESITPSQLNRHLASLSGQYPKQQPSASTTLPVRKPLESKMFYDTEKYPNTSIFSSKGRAQDFAPWLRVAMLSIVLAISVSLGYTAFRAMAILFIQFYGRFALSSSTAPTIASAAMTTPMMTTANPPGLTSLTLKTQITDLTETFDTLSVSNVGDFSEISQLLADRHTKSNVFQFQVVGDCHVIIKQPAAMKSHRLDVKVTRGSVSLPYELAKLFDGVYTLRLNREDAYGLVNVTLSSRSRPPKEETLEVDFGTPWLKIENWKRAARTVSAQIKKDLDSAQTGLSDIYARLSTDIQVWMGDVVKKSHTIQKEAKSLHLDDRQFRARLDAIVKRSKNISDAITRSTSRQFDMASATLDQVQKQSIAVNKEIHDFLNETRRFLSSRSNDLNELKGRLQGAMSSDLLVRAQKSAKRLTDQIFFRRFAMPPRRPQE